MRGLDRLLMAVTAFACASFAISTVLGLRAARDNGVISALAANHDRPVNTDARDEVLLARAEFLFRMDRLDEAQVWIEEAMPSVTSPSVRANLFYNLANARLRNAFVLIQRGEIDAAAANVRLAKEGYRQALRIQPQDWNAKYNLEVAMRLVRDFPQLQAELQEAPLSEMPKRLWTDLPRQPRGLPR